MNKWDKFASDYENMFYSITKWKEKRDRIINELSDNSNILIIGCGSEIYLIKDIIELFPNSKITLNDISQEMLTVSKNKFSHDNIKYECFSMMDGFKPNYFDIIISTNSILMPKIEENNIVFKNCLSALKENGKLIAYLPSFESCKNSIRLDHSINKFIKLNEEEQLVIDPIDNTCQSFHTKKSIKKALKHVSSIIIDKVSCTESDLEFNHFKKLYGTIMSDELIKGIYEYFVVVKK